MLNRLSAHLKDGKQNLPPLSPVEVLSPLVTVALGPKSVLRLLRFPISRCILHAGCNPSSFSLQGTNTYLVGAGPRKILVDSGEGRVQYLDQLAAAMEQCGCTCVHL
jgi:hypothetical protein